MVCLLLFLEAVLLRVCVLFLLFMAEFVVTHLEEWSVFQFPISQSHHFPSNIYLLGVTAHHFPAS